MQRGFTLVELIVVVALVAVAAGVASLAFRDPAATQLEREASRLAMLLEAGRAEARAGALPVRWRPLPPAAGGDADFVFEGLPPRVGLPRRWLAPGVRAEVVGAPVVLLGPEALIGAQRIVLSLDERRAVLATDGFRPFDVVGTGR